MPSKTIGFLVATDKATWNTYITAFENSLQNLGWNKVNAPTGNNHDVVIDYGNDAQGDLSNYNKLASYFVNKRVDIIVTSGTGAAVSCQKATANIPIVFASVGDPVGAGLVASIPAPGGNVTGGCNQQIDSGMVGLRVKHLLDEWKITYPHASINKLGVVYSDVAPTGIPSPGLAEANLVMHATAALNPVGICVRTQHDIQAINTAGVDAFFVCSDPVITEFADDLSRACGSKFTAHAFAEYFDHHHGSCSFGPIMSDMFTQAAVYVDQILRHNNPGQFAGTLPVFTVKTEARPKR
jgi:putative tryptophan/tyrosine transport system substrate-binding protein